MQNDSFDKLGKIFGESEKISHQNEIIREANETSTRSEDETIKNNNEKPVHETQYSSISKDEIETAELLAESNDFSEADTDIIHAQKDMTEDNEQSQISELDEILVESKKKVKSYPAEEDIEKRDYMPVRSRRESGTGLLGGIMYFVFVISLSVVLACIAWMAANDVLALNKDIHEGEVILPKEIFSEKEIEAKDSNGNTIVKRILVADTGYVAKTLKNMGIIEYPWLFKLFCDVSKAEYKLDPGVYNLSSEFDYRALVKKMQIGSGSMVETQLLFYEGMTMKQIFELLEENNIASVQDLQDAATNSVYDYRFLDFSTPGTEGRLEGYLFPDTYNFYQGMQASSAINKFISNLNKKISADMYTQAENMGRSMHEIFIIASMIESEAANDDEREIIASVIYNRLRAGMPLQIDATIQYALPERKAQLSLEDLEIESPYNTYKNAGLPIGPICNPGLASIKAALNPASTNYLFYALDMETRTHKFFTNEGEHNAFVNTQDYSKLGS